MPLLRLSSAVQPDGSLKLRLHNAGEPISGFHLCFSLLSLAVVVSGARTVRQVANFLEVAPEPEVPLGNGESWELVVAYGFERHHPANVSWGPQLPYVALADGTTIDVEPTPLDFSAIEPVAAPEPPSPEAPELSLIPHPESWTAGMGSCDASAGFRLSPEAPNFLQGAFQAVEALAQRCGFSPWVGPGVTLQFEPLDSANSEEAYALAIIPGSVTLRAAHHSGALHALISLLQLRQTGGGSLPCGVLQDQPRFSWRGQHLDCARHFYQVESVLRLLDLMALLKLNRFHWHFIDDEAFRLELDSAPELAQETASRGHHQRIPGLFGGGAGPLGGTYSQAEVRTVVEHAQALGIEVMPEIEIPAHAWALLQVHPEFRDPEDESREQSVQGYLENTFNPAVPEVWTFLRPLLAEIVNLFPFGVVHLGCDELPPRVWEKSPAVQRLKAEQGLETTDDVQEWTMRRAAELVVQSGGRPAAWEEAGRGQQGGMGHGGILFSWSGQGPGLEAARAGYEVVMCPAQHIYFDMAPTPRPHERGMNWAAYVRMQDALEWHPVPPDEPELEERIIGVQGELWSETVQEDAMMEPMLAPRILALAEVAWSSESRKRPLAPFCGAAQAFEPIWRSLGWNCGELI